MKASKEGISFVTASLLLVVAVALTKNYQFLGSLAVIYLGFFLVELAYVKVTGKTISRRFWDWDIKATKNQKILFAVAMQVYLIYLLGHLLLQW